MLLSEDKSKPAWCSGFFFFVLCVFAVSWLGLNRFFLYSGFLSVAVCCWDYFSWSCYFSPAVWWHDLSYLHCITRSVGLWEVVAICNFFVFLIVCLFVCLLLFPSIYCVCCHLLQWVVLVCGFLLLPPLTSSDQVLLCREWVEACWVCCGCFLVASNIDNLCCCTGNCNCWIFLLV